MKLAYRQMAMKFHPDKDAASSRCLLLQTLSDPDNASPENSEVMSRVKYEAGALFGIIQTVSQ